MRHFYSFRGNAIAVISIVLFSMLHSGVFAQSGTPLDANTLARLIDSNQKDGHPAFYRICEQYDLSVDNADMAAKYEQSIISSIKGLEGVISCVVDPASKVVHVRFPKATEKVQGPEHIADMKAILDTYHLRMISYKEAAYQL